MANLTETSEFPAGITRIETNEPVVGGEDGVSNRALKQLGNRTRWLKDQITAILDGFALKVGTYPGLRAQATTKGDVGLGLVANFTNTSDPLDGSADKYATAAAVRAVRDLITGTGGSGSGTTGGARVASGAADASAALGPGITGPTATLTSLTAAVVVVNASFSVAFTSTSGVDIPVGLATIEVRVAGGAFTVIGSLDIQGLPGGGTGARAYAFSVAHIPTAGQTHDYRLTLSGDSGFATSRRVTAVAHR